METQKTPNSQNDLEKEGELEESQSDLTILQSYSNQNSMVLAQKQTHGLMEQERKPRSKPTHYGQTISDKIGMNIQWRKDSLFNKSCWENWAATHETINLEHCLTPYTKINSKWIKDLNVRPLLEENTGRTFFDINHSNISFDPSSSVMETKAKIKGT